MDIDMLKSSTDEQFEMMFMMHMDKSDPNSTQMMSFSCSSHHHTNTMAQLYETNPQVALSFPNNNIQNPLSLPNSFPNGSGNGNGLQSVSSSSSSTSQQKQTSMAAMREMIFRIAAMQPIYIDPESVKPPKRRNVRISKDPQSVAARHRRERISERIRILQRLVPGGTKMDTASMLDEAIHYVKFLKSQVQTLERAAVNNQRPPLPVGFPVAVSNRSSGYFLGTGGKANNNYAMGAQAGSASQYVQQFSDGGG